MDGIVDLVRKELGIGKKVKHELYKLLIYEQGSFFAPHRDTEKTLGMFATLVVCLPSRHEGGTLIVTHDGETKRIDFGGDKSEFNIQYAAFYADPACRAFATEIIGRWKKPKQSFSASKQTSLPSRMLTLLDRMGAADLAARFVHDVLPLDCDGQEGAALARLGNRYGWQPLAKPLQHFFAQQAPADYSSKLATPVTIFEALCCGEPTLTDERRSVCIALADELERLIERWDAHRDQGRYRPEARSGIVEAVFRAFEALGESDRLERFVTYVLAGPRRNDLHAVLVPAVKAIHSGLASDSVGRSSFDRLLQHCLAMLRTATAMSIEPPADWTREADIECACVDCLELVQFMRNPTEQIHRFPRRKDLRQHLHQQMERYRLDLAHVTARTGSPQTLVCTKTQATYERRLAQFNVDTQLLKELEELASPKTARLDLPSDQRRTKLKKASSVATLRQSRRKK